MPHMVRPLRPGLFSQGETELFDDGIGQNFARNAFDFGLSLLPTQSSVERKFAVFSLADALEPFVAHFLERAVNRLALGIEDTLLKRDVDVGCHKGIIIRDRLGAGSY